jgi:hypothetical protein
MTAPLNDAARFPVREAGGVVRRGAPLPRAALGFS